MVTVIAAAVASTPAAAQEASGDAAEVRIVARKLASGRIEFGLQQRSPDNSWGDRQLPRVRFFPTTAALGRWLASSALDLPVGEVRIVARKLASGRIEFGLQQRSPDNSWGDRQLPRVRFFPTTAALGRWLVSSPLTLNLPQPAVTTNEPPTSTGQRDTAQFTAVAAGGLHSCGLRTDGTITCWGANHQGQASPPRGRFTAVAAGLGHSCALGTDPTIICWGRVASVRASATVPFNAVAGGDGHLCALRTNGTIICWGSNANGETHPVPVGRFTAVAGGGGHSCGVRTDGTIECWGANRVGQSDAPAGQYTDVTAGSWHSCGLRTDGAIECWGANDFEQTTAPTRTGHYTIVGGSDRYECRRYLADRTIICWGTTDFGQADAPDGQYTAITARGNYSCALRTDGTITCWGRNNYGQTEAPDGQFTAIAAGHAHSCGLRTDGTITCWGGDDYGQATPPAT